MISANSGLPAPRYTPQVTPRWPRGFEPASWTSDVFYSPFGLYFIHFVQKGHSFIAFHFANPTFHTYCITSLLQGLAHTAEHARWSVIDLPYVVL